ncbi:MAG: caspase family protein [Thermoplasmata archaeon]|nr:caspase family protein [Thermoplasmata archaeon]
MIKRYLKIICVLVSLLFLFSVAAPATAAICENTESLFERGDDFKDVYARAKPENPGKPDKPPKPDDPPDEDPTVDKWAVVIGIADYQGRFNDLAYTDDDAEDMYDYLIDKGYPEGNIKKLIDRKAKGDNIYSAISWMRDWEGPDSECVFFYSGHGSTYDGYNDGDTEDRDESIITWGLKHILDGFLRDAFAGFESSKLTFIFDSCYSGGMDDLAGPGRVVVTACGEEQLSFDGSSAMQNGVFSYYFLDGLYQYNTIEGAFTYGAPLATAWAAENYDATMNPQIYDQYSGDWAF